MTPEQIQLVREVVELVGQHPEFAGTFYGRLFDAAPQTRAMFGDMDAQQRKLVEELAAMVDLLANLDGLQGRAADLGERHRGYGVKAAHYRMARGVMVDALDAVLGDAFTPAHHDAWNRATMLITELMQTT